ncbi:MAG TPA: DUF3108 domain-containing protein [Bacteroidota bacterium]|nr:DUF3108 domain-containing protein [Bacteroidota bacterium]
MNTLSRIRILLACLICFSVLIPWSRFLRAGEPPSSSPCDSTVFCPGEDLVYEVSWARIKLGRIHIHTTPGPDGNATHFGSVAHVDSYPDLPLVDLHVIQHSSMDAFGYSLATSSKEKRDKEWIAETLHNESGNKRLIVERRNQVDLKTPPYGAPVFDTLTITETPFYDGLSLLYFGRIHSRNYDSVNVPTYVYGKVGRTILKRPERTYEVSIDAIDHPIRTVEIEGKALFKGIFGMTGVFRGWFSDDAAAVPIRAEMEVILGHVTLELISWQREGWTPPGK